MKRLWIALLLLPWLAIGQGFNLTDVAFLGNKQQASSSSPTYIVQQDFESAGTPSGWTGFSGTFTFHNTSGPLEGTGDLTETGSTAQCYAQYAAQNEVFIVFLWKAVTIPSATANVFGFFDSGFAHGVSEFEIINTGQIKGFCNAVQYGAMGTTISANTLYYVKVHYKIGTGANAQCSVEFSSSGTWTGSGLLFISTSSGAATTQTTDADFINDGGSSVFHIDHVRISATDLGSSFSNWP